MTHPNQDRREQRKAERERKAQNNADIRPWISIGEAAQLSISRIAAKMEKPDRG